MAKVVCTNPAIGKFLHAYELGVLSTSDVDLFETHLLDCEYCFAEIRQFVDEAELLKSNEAVIREVAGGIESAASGGGKKSVAARLWSRLWPDTPIIFRPAAALLLVLILIYPAFRGIFKGTEPGLKPVSSLSLLDSRSNNFKEFVIKDNNDLVLCFLYQDGEVGRKYTLELVDENNEVLIYDDDFTSIDKYGLGRLLIPSSRIKTGNYHLKLSDPDKNSPLETVVYDFRLSK